MSVIDVPDEVPASGSTVNLQTAASSMNLQCCIHPDTCAAEEFQHNQVCQHCCCRLGAATAVRTDVHRPAQCGRRHGGGLLHVEAAGAEGVKNAGINCQLACTASTQTSFHHTVSPY
jgi:hypothetical protein